MSIFDKVRARRDDDSVLRAKEHVKRCEQYQKAGRIRDALTEAEHAVRLDPGNADTYYGLGRCHHAIARAENDRAGGNIYFRAGLEQLGLAIAAFRKVITLQPHAADGFLGLGLACDNAYRPDEAEKYYKEAMRLDPAGMDGVDARFNLALLLHMQSIGWAGQKQFPNHLHVSSDDPSLLRSFDLAEEAIRVGEQITRQNPGYVTELVHKHRMLAGWCDRTLQGGRALPHYQAILRLNPGDAKATEWLKDAERNTGRKLM